MSYSYKAKCLVMMKFHHRQLIIYNYLRHSTGKRSIPLSIIWDRSISQIKHTLDKPQCFAH